MQSAAGFNPIKGASDGKAYKCTMCGSASSTVIRQDKENPRLKCDSCSFVYNGRDSLEAQEAGTLTSSQESVDGSEEPARETTDTTESPRRRMDKNLSTMLHPQIGVPARPKYVFVSKNRKSPKVEFCGQVDVKKTALKWHETKYDVYELVPRKFEVRVDLG